MSKKKKLFLAIFSSVFAFWVLFLALVPTLLAHGGLKHFIKKKAPGHFSYEKARLSWFKPQTLTQVTYTSPTENLSIKVDELTTKASLLNLMMNSQDLKEVHLKGLSGYYKPSEQKADLSTLTESLAPVLEASPSLQDKPAFFVFSLPFQGKLHLDESSFELQNSHYEPIEFKHIQLDCNILSKSGPLLANLACETSQKELMGSVIFNFELGGFSQDGSLIMTPFDKDLFFLSPQGYLDLDAQLTNLPCKGLDDFTGLYYPKLKGAAPSLLGNSLNLGSQIHMVKGKTHLELNAKAPQLDLKFKGTASANHFTLDEASVCHLKLSPEFMEVLAKNGKYDLLTEKPFDASIFLDRLSFPLDLKTLNLASLSCNAHFSMGPVEFTPSSLLEGLKINEVSGVLDSFDMGENATFHLKATAENQEKPLSAKLDAEISKLVDFQEEKGLNKLQGNIQLNLKDVPSHFLAFNPEKKQFLQELLGPLTNIEASYKGSINEGELSVTTDTSRFKIEPLHFTLNNSKELHLSKVTPLQVRLNPSFSHNLISSSFTLLHPFDAQGKLKKLNLDLSSAENLIRDVDLKLTFNPFEATYQSSKPIQIPESKVYIKTNEAKKLQTEAYFTAHLPGEYDQSILSSLFDFSIVFNNIPSFSKNQEVDLTARVKNSNLVTEFSATIDSLQNLKIKEPVETILYPFSTNLASTTIHFTEPTYLKTAPFECALKDLDLSSICLEGIAETQSCTLIHEKSRQTFEDLSAPFYYFPFENRVNFKLDAKNNALNLSGTLSEISFSPELKAHCDLQAKVSASTQSFLNFLNLSNEAVASLLSSHSSCFLHFKGHLAQQIIGHLAYEFSNPQLHSKGHLALEDEIYLLEPLSINASLSSSNWDKIKNQIATGSLSNIEIEKDSNLSIIIERMHRKRGTLKALPEHFLAKASLDHCTLNSTNLKNVSFSLEASNPKELIKFEVHAETPEYSSKNGKLSLKGHLLEVESLNHDFSWDKLSANLLFQATYLPTQLVEEALKSLPISQTLNSQVLGKALQMQMGLKWTQGVGPFSLSLQSDQVQAKLQFDCNQGEFTLSKDLEIKAKLNESLAKDYLAKFNPFLNDACYSKHPVSLEIPAKALSFNLNAANAMDSLHVEEGTLYLDQLRMQNHKTLEDVLAFFDANTRKKEIQAWFTPLSFSVKEGVLHLSSNHFQLHNRFHLVLWGNYHLSTGENQFYLAMPHTTLIKEFNLKRLPSTYMFQIPICSDQGTLLANWNTAHQQLDVLCSSKSPFVAQNSLADSSSHQDILRVLSETQPSKEQAELSLDLPWERKDRTKAKEKEQNSKKTAETQQQSQILKDFFEVLKKRIR